MRVNPIFTKIMEQDLGKEIKASCLLIASSREIEQSLVSQNHGVFTENLIKIFDGGNFDGNYKDFIDKIKLYSPKSSNPVLIVLGENDIDIESQDVFSI